MTAGSSVCLQLGDANKCSDSAYSEVIAAKTEEELVIAKTGFGADSIARLDIFVEGSDLASLYNPMELASWVPLLKVDAKVLVHVENSENADLKTINTSFLLAGLSSLSERREMHGSRVLVASRKAAPAIHASILKKKASGPVVTLELGVNDDDVDVIDEDGLLDDTLLAPPPAMNTLATVDGDDCVGRTPCDNCTCGRAEKESGNEPKQAPSSSCGKCHLGDAFRCASCPYLGMPAFKAEENLVLQLTDDL